MLLVPDSRSNELRTDAGTKLILPCNCFTFALASHLIYVTTRVHHRHKIGSLVWEEEQLAPPGDAARLMALRHSGRR